MQAILDSGCDVVGAEATVTEEVRVFRDKIAQWAARYVERHDSADGDREAAANFRSWSHEYFRATKVTGARGVCP